MFVAAQFIAPSPAPERTGKAQYIAPLRIPHDRINQDNLIIAPVCRCSSERPGYDAGRNFGSVISSVTSS